MDKLIGSRISQARKAKQLTQENLAEFSGMSVSAISRIETGKNSTSLKTLCKFCDILDVGLDYFLYDLLPAPLAVQDPVILDIIGILDKLDESKKGFVLEILNLYVKQFGIL